MEKSNLLRRRKIYSSGAIIGNCSPSMPGRKYHCRACDTYFTKAGMELHLLERMIPYDDVESYHYNPVDHSGELKWKKLND
jgi:hypothetical protein